MTSASVARGDGCAVRRAVERGCAWISRAPATFLLLFALAVFVTAVFSRIINRDEGQYASAAELALTGLPYRDFPYLQTPLQPLLLAPLARIGGAALLLDLRLANAVAAALGVACVFRAARAAGGDTGQAIFAALLLIGCEPLIFGAAVARNDALPMLCEAFGLWMLAAALSGRAGAGQLFLAGLAFAAAVSIKLTYAFPAASAGLIVLARSGRGGRTGPLAFLAGGLVGMAPTLLLFAVAPESFLFGVLHYGSLAPRQWCAFNHCTALAIDVRLVQSLRFLVQGPALLALAIVACDVIRHGLRRETAWLDAMIVAGIVAAAMPPHALRQYMIPLLAPLFTRLGAIRSPLALRPATILLALELIVGIGHTAYLATALPATGSPILATVRDVRWLGGALADRRISGPIVALSPERIAGSGATLDPRFAPGPFLFRSSGLLALEREERLHALTWRRMESAFARSPPAAIVLGGERLPEPAIPHGLDAIPERWALAHNYVARTSPSGTLVLYTPP